MKFDYFYNEQSESYSFYRTPKVFFTDDRFRCLSSDAKILYGILLDRVSLSARNKWIDEQGRIYVYMTISSIEKSIGRCHQKSCKLLDELERIGLIERVKQGQGKPTRIYVKNFIVVCGSYSKKYEKHTQGSMSDIRMIQDILNYEEPKRRYINNPLECPLPYQAILSRYETLMKADQKSSGTIRTRSGRMKMFFIYLAEIKCYFLQTITPGLFADYVSSLNDRYSSQGKTSILYTIRNFFSYDEFSEMLTFNLLPFLSGIHSKKHERLPSFYTAEEVRRIMNAVDRNTPWGKTVYLMMLLACVYGLRSSDIITLDFDDINWEKRTITIMQVKTHKEVYLPITDEVLFAMLDYIKNARPKVENPKVFIRLKKPHIPYSKNDHFGDKIFPYFEIAGVDTKGKHHVLHSLRHSLATSLLDIGTPVNEISVILGHTSAASTKTYIWSDIEHLRIAALEVPEK